MVEYNASIHHDRIFYRQDIQGSIAYARANCKLGLLTEAEFALIEEGLGRVKKEWDDDTFEIKAGVDEDIHTANERRLGELIGSSIAGKLHTGRSRNDQVATDMRLWLREELTVIQGYLRDLLDVIASRAEQEVELLMPGYTHLQRAQPIRWSHWLLSYGFAFVDDLQRLSELGRRVNRCPLGSGALAGNPFGIDRRAMAVELGFPDILPNSMGAVADRDFVIETMQWGATLMQHLSRWAEDLIIYSSAEFNFVRLADAYSTGSSLMPQKRNGDALELLRGKSGRVFGQMAGLMYTVKGLPSTYNKDLQESVPALLDHVKTVRDSIQIATGLLSTLDTNRDGMSAALSPDMLATDLADYLVRRGVPFRETHHISGRVVALAEGSGVGMDQLRLEQLQAIDARFQPDVMGAFDYQRSVEARDVQGGTSRAAVLQQVRAMRAEIQASRR